MSSRRPIDAVQAAWIAAALLAATLAPAPALASTPAPEAAESTPADDAAESPAFLEAYARALRLYKDANYGEALAAYEEARAISPAPEVIYGIGRCMHQLGRFAEAATAYEAFLTSASDHSGAAKARAYLVEVRDRLTAARSAEASAAGGAISAPPPLRKRAALARAIALGGGAAAIVVATVVTILLVARRPAPPDAPLGVWTVAATVTSW